MSYKRLTQALLAGDASETKYAARVIEHLEGEILHLTQLRQLDMAEIVRLRRLAEAVGEGRI